MHLTAEQMSGLKKVNISKNPEKSKARIAEDFKSASNEKKEEIVKLSGLARRSFYSTFNTGNATAKVVLALAQALDVTPYYYTGEVDEKEPCTADILKQFLQSRGYAKLAEKLGVKTKRAYNRKPKPEAVDVSVQAPVSEKAVNTSHDDEQLSPELEAAITHDMAILKERFADSEEMTSAIEGLSEEEAITLLKGLFIRAKAGGDSAAVLYDVKRWLLT